MIVTEVFKPWDPNSSEGIYVCYVLPGESKEGAWTVKNALPSSIFIDKKMYESDKEMADALRRVINGFAE